MNEEQTVPVLGTFVRAPVQRWLRSAVFDYQLDVRYLLPKGQFFACSLWEGYHVSHSAGSWEQAGEQITVAGVTETLVSDCQPFERFSPLQQVYRVEHTEADLALVQQSTLSDGTAWHTRFAFAGWRTCVVPESHLYPAEWFPKQWSEVSQWADRLLERAKGGVR